MIIKEIHIDGFGIYNDFSIGNLQTGVNIILGNNEAGKTTILKFIRFTLFGYPRLKENRMAPFKGGAHGGTIKALLKSGKEIAISRKGSGSTALFFSGREYNNESDILQLFGNTSSSLYNNVYAFTLDELVNLTSLTDSGVEDKIFSVGMGLGNISLADVESDIRNRINDIYKSTGRNQQIPEILKLLTERKSEIFEKQALLPRRRELALELEHLEKENAWLDDAAKKKSAEKSVFENYLKCYESVISLINAERELEQLPAPEELPEEGLQKLERQEEKIRDLRLRLEELQSGTTEGNGISVLEDLAGTIIFNQALLDESGKVEYLKNNLSGYRTAKSDFNQSSVELNALSGKIRDNLDGINPAWSEKNVTLIKGIDVHKAVIRSFRQELEELSKRRIAAESNIEILRHRERGINVSGLAVVVALVLIVISVPAFYYGFYIAGGALALAALIVFVGRKFLVQESARLAAEKELDEIATRAERAKESYRSYLGDKLDLASSLAPDAAEDALADIDKTIEFIRQKTAIQVKQTEQRMPLIDEFESVALSLSYLVSPNVKSDNIEILVTQIISEYTSSVEKSNKKAAVDAELKMKKQEAESIQGKIDEAGVEIRSLMDLAGTKEPWEFRQKIIQNIRAKQLFSEKRNAELTIESITGIGKSEDAVAFFRKKGKERVISDIEEMKSTLADIEKSFRDTERRIGELKNEIKRVEEGADMSGAMTGLETGKYKLKLAVKNWLEGRLALDILSEVRADYEKQKQPAVINNTARYFSAVTSGRYNRLNVSQGEKDFQIYDSSGVFRTTGQLSRGTKEQLLLSLRLGFIEEYEKHSEPLPVIVDEVLVNFDTERARRMAGVLAEFSGDRQILLFTCHPGTLNLFDEKAFNLIRL